MVASPLASSRTIEELRSFNADILVPRVEVMVEDLCATFRRNAALLDDLTFANVQEKTAVLSKIREAGVDRKTAHDHSNAIALSIGLFMNLPQRPSRLFILFNRAQRMNLSYEIFDKALRSATNRIPTEEITKLECGRRMNPEFENPPGSARRPCPVGGMGSLRLGCADPADAG